jgi:inorganic pyrophosphatase
MNLWHEIAPGTKESMNVIIEINKGSKNKYEIDKKTGLISLDRVMSTGQDYPFDYGFVPQTLWHDGDALDVAVLSTYAFVPGVMVKCRPVAVIHMVDGGEADDKIVAVPVDDPRFAKVRDLEDVNPHTLLEMEHFFLTYKKLQNKDVVINGVDGRAVAEAAFEESLKIYRDKYPQKKNKEV